MKKIIALLAAFVLVLGLGGFSIANAKGGPDPRVTFCHSTSSTTNPFVKITTSANAFYEGHVLNRHTSDIYPAVTFTHGKNVISVTAQGDQSVLANGCVVPTDNPTDNPTPPVVTEPPVVKPSTEPGPVPTVTPHKHNAPHKRTNVSNALPETGA